MKPEAHREPDAGQVLSLSLQPTQYRAAVLTPQAAKATALHRHAAATWQQQEEGEGLVPRTPKTICCLFFIPPFCFLK